MDLFIKELYIEDSMLYNTVIQARGWEGIVYELCVSHVTPITPIMF